MFKNIFGNLKSIYPQVLKGGGGGHEDVGSYFASKFSFVKVAC